MVFIGSRINLHYISDNFKDVWITFIRQFNHSFPRKIKKKEFQRKIISLKEKIEILVNEVLQKIKVLDNQSEQFNETKENLTALVLSLKQLDESFEFSIPNSIEFRKREIADNIEGLIKHIKKIKLLISLYAKSYVKNSRRKFLVKGVTAASLIGMLTSFQLAKYGISTLLNISLNNLAKKLSLKKDGLAILISFQAYRIDDTWLRNNAELFLPAYIARMELAFGQKTNIVLKAATRNDFLTVINDNSIQNIVLFGHGSWDSWISTDGPISTFDNEIINCKKRKRGLLLRHTCGEGSKGFYISEETKNLLEKSVKKLNNILYPNYFFGIYPDGKDPFYPNTYGLIYFGLFHAKDGIVQKNLRGAYKYVNGCEFEVWEDREMQQDELILDSLRTILDQKQGAIGEVKKVLGTIRQIVKKIGGEHHPQGVQFGVPIFKENKIKGWTRTTSPIDFMVHPFGDGEEKYDHIYAMK